MNSEKTYGTNFLPSGPMLTLTMSSTKPVKPSTATCQRPGTSSRFMPPHEHRRSAPSATSIHSGAVGEADVVPPEMQRNQRLHRELVHRVDLAFGRHASCLPLLVGPEPGPGLGNSHDVPDADAEPEEQHQQEEQRERPVAEPIGQAIQTPSDHRAAERSADQVSEELLPEPIARVRLRSAGPLRFRLLQASSRCRAIRAVRRVEASGPRRFRPLPCVSPVRRPC